MGDESIKPKEPRPGTEPPPTNPTPPPAPKRK